MAKAISWGKPSIYIAPSGSAPGAQYKWELLATPVEGSTNLTGTQGDKTEAKIEGGEAEATKYNAATFELTMNVRMALESNNKHRLLPTELYGKKDVIISGVETKAVDLENYSSSSVAVILIPQDAEAPGFYCPSASVSIMESYTADDGAMWEITLAPNASGTSKAVQFGKFTATMKMSGDGPDPTNVNIGADTGVAITMEVQRYAVAKNTAYTTYSAS